MIEHINFAKEMQVPHPVQVENGDIVKLYPCLLYTSDAADEEDSVDLGGRRIIKKKNYHNLFCFKRS